MRRMATTKQLDYINDLSEVAEKGFKIGTYPHKIYIVNEGEFNWEYLQSEILDEVDFENHTFDADLMIDLPRLLEQYGLSDGGSVPYIFYRLENSVTMPNSVVDFNSLQSWMRSEAFITAINSAGYYIDEVLAVNDVAHYIGDDPVDNIILYNGELKLNTYVVCEEGEGQQIIDASNPIGENTLDVKNLRAENIISDNIKPWYFLNGGFTDSDNIGYLFSNGPVAYVSNKNQYSGFAMYVNSDSQLDSISVWADFEQKKLFRNGTTEISIVSGSIELVNALTGEVEKIFEY